MLRYSLLLIFVLLSIYGAYAQPTVNVQSMPKVGDKFLLYDCDSTGVTQGSAGANITWDFSKLTRLTGSDYVTEISFIEPSFGPQSDKFPTATIAQLNDTAAVYYRTTSAGLFRMGVGAFELYESLSVQDQHMKFPFNYGNEFTGTFKGMIYTGEVNVGRYGESKIKYDAYGTIKMPYGTVPNVYRINHEYTIWDSVDVIPGFPPIVIRTITRNYNWYQAAKFQPVLSISYIDVSFIGFPGVPTSIKIVTYSQVETSAGLKPPTLVSPPNNAANLELPVTLQWENQLVQVIDKSVDELQAETGIQYHLQVSADPGFSTTITDNHVTETSYILNSLEKNTTYFWRVRAKQGDYYSDFSSIWNFSTKKQGDIVIPEPPILISPENGSIVENKIPILIWEEGANSEYTWKVEVARDMDFEEIIFSENPRMTNTLEFDYEFDAGVYFWRVAVNNGQAWSDWSEVWYFIIGPGEIYLEKPILYSPENGAENLPFNEIIFTWSSDENAEGWILQIGTDAEFDYTFYIGPTSDTSVTVADFGENTTYYWRVVAGASEIVSEWSDVWSFTTMSSGSVRYHYGSASLAMVPNPADKVLNIEFDNVERSSTSLEIYDALGNVILKKDLGIMEIGRQKLTQSVSDFATGTYFVVVNLGDRRFANQFKIVR